MNIRKHFSVTYVVIVIPQDLLQWGYASFYKRQSTLLIINCLFQLYVSLKEDALNP